MKKIKPLHPKDLRQKLAAGKLGFTTTDEIKHVTEFVGQERALDAIHFGVGIEHDGYNLYAMGPTGIGKFSLIKNVVEQYAAKQPIPSDWCYVYNFTAPEKPIPLELPPGKGNSLVQDMKVLMETLPANILDVFESSEYRLEIRKIHKDYTTKRKRAYKRNHSKVTLERTPRLYKEQHEREKLVQTKLVTAVIQPAINKIKRKYKKLTEVSKYLNAVRDDIIEHFHEFIKQDEKTNLLTFSLETPALTKYKVNLLVDNSELKGAPVIFEETPSYTSLIARVEHTGQLGSLTTNFSLIRPGALHLANGGYLILEARKIKKNPEAWEALKNALYSNIIEMKPIESETDSVKLISLDPLPIPLKVKVILFGTRNGYYNLCHHDCDFTELFKVPVDFDEQIDRNTKNIQLYAQLMTNIARREKTRPLHASAVAAIIDQCSRLAEDVEKLSTHIRDIESLIMESNYWAGLENKKIIEASDVKTSIQAQIKRMARSRDLYYEDILRDFIIIDTQGKTVGQVNCLSVRRVGNYDYGHPTRVTARARVGKGKVIDIQREINLAGPFHSKAAITIANFIASRFNNDKPFALHASLSFEQIYCWTEGDSASIGELCALLSALADVPILQTLAVTGSIDQHGNAQAIGGVNEKIEGFFDVCKAKGLTGKQGVIIPAVNIKNLMLREDVVTAAKANKFFIYPVNNVDEAISLLTGVPCGERDANDQFPKDTLYYKIEKQLYKFAMVKMK